MLTEDHNTEFPTGNLDSFLNELNTPKQDMNIEQSSILDDTIPDENAQLFETPTNPNEPDSDEFQLDEFTSEAASEILVGIIDTALPAGLAWLAHGKTEEFQAEKDQKKTLTKSFKKYLDAKGIDLPPGWLLLFLVLTIYGVKVPTAISMRKEYNEISENQKLIFSQKRQIELQEKKIAALKKEQEQVETPETNE